MSIIGSMKIKTLHREAQHAYLYLAEVERALKDAKHDAYSRAGLDLTKMEAQLASAIACATRLRDEIAKANK